MLRKSVLAFVTASGIYFNRCYDAHQLSMGKLAWPGLLDCIDSSNLRFTASLFLQQSQDSEANLESSETVLQSSQQHPVDGIVRGRSEVPRPLCQRNEQNLCLSLFQALSSPWSLRPPLQKARPSASPSPARHNTRYQITTIVPPHNMASKRRTVDIGGIHTANGTEYHHIRTQSVGIQTSSKLLPHIRSLPQPPFNQSNRHPQLLAHPHRRHQRQRQSLKTRLLTLLPTSPVNRRRPRQSNRSTPPRSHPNLHPQILRLLPPTSRQLHPQSQRLFRLRLRPLRRSPLRLTPHPPKRKNRIRSLPLRLPTRRRRIP